VKTARLEEVFVYPVKSCRGIARESARVDATGLTGDRHWMLVRPNGRFVTQRELPRLALIGTALDESGLTLVAPGRDAVHVARDAGHVARAVTVWKFAGSGIDCGDEAAAWCSEFLETPLRLVRFDPAQPRVCGAGWTGDTQAVTQFSDEYPMLVISRASLADLNSRLPKALPMERFRPNLVINGVGAYDEDRIHELRSGDLAIRLVKACTRCSITTTDQQRGAVDGVEPLATLKTYRHDRELKGVIFGQNAIPAAGVGSTLRVGQTFEIVWK
jgi:uncharacterized protein YcbX